MSNKFGFIHRTNNSSWFCRDNIHYYYLEFIITIRTINIYYYYYYYYHLEFYIVPN